MPDRRGGGRDGLPSFDRLRYRRQDSTVFRYAFDLLELDGRDLRREPTAGKRPAGEGVRLWRIN